MANLEETKKILKSLLTSTPLKLTLNQLNQDYKEIEGCEIPYRNLGYESLEHLIYSIPDTVEILGCGMFAEVRPVIDKHGLSSEISRLVSKQRVNNGKKPTRSKGRKQRRQPRRSTQGNFNSITNKSYNTNKTIIGTNTCDKNIFLPAVKRNTQIQNSTSALEESRHIPNEINYSFKSNYLREVAFFSETETESDYEDIYINYKIPSKMQNNLEVLIKNNSEGIWCAKLPVLYKNAFGSDLSYSTYGYKSLSHMCVELSNIFSCVQINGGDFKLFSKTSTKELPVIEHIGSSTGILETNKPVSTYGKIEHESTKNYESSKDSVYSQSLSVYNKSDILPSVQSDFECTKNNTSSKCSVSPENRDTELVDDLVYATLEKDFPLNTVKLFEELEKQWISDDVDTSDFIDIQVTEVYDPSKFWIVLVNSECYSKFNELKEEMQNFYKSYARNLTINNRKLIRIGLYCSVMYNTEYRRAIVVNTLNENPGYVRVFYIDYGTLLNVPTCEIFFLHRQFFQLPAQAIRARLASLLPLTPNSPWSTECCEKFLNMIEDKQLVAQIASMDREKNVLDLFVCDTNTEKDIYIREYLVSEGLAIFANQTQALKPILDDTITQNEKPKCFSKKDIKNYLIKYQQKC